MSHSVHLATALEAARAAAEVVRHYYQSNLAVTIKADKSPVTEADVEAEKTIRSILAHRFPGHGFHGEETGTSQCCSAGSAMPRTFQAPSAASMYRCGSGWGSTV